MDHRLKLFYVAEADAIQRQEMARIARSVAAAFSGSQKDFADFIDRLEVTRSRQERWDSAWDNITLVGRR